MGVKEDACLQVRGYKQNMENMDVMVKYIPDVDNVPVWRSTYYTQSGVESISADQEAKWKMGGKMNGADLRKVLASPAPGLEVFNC